MKKAEKKKGKAEETKQVKKKKREELITGIEVTASSEEEFIRNYDDSKYEKPSMTADINIFTVMDEEQGNYRKLSEKKLKLLMIRRGAYPFKDHYALPGGFVKKDETIEEAAARELQEETGVVCDFLKQIHTVSTPGRDPRRWVITTSFLALMDATDITLEGGDDAADAQWFNISLVSAGEDDKSITWKLFLENGETELTAVLSQEKDPRYMEDFPKLTLLENAGIAFDHAWIITHALLTLRRLIGSTNTSIIFELLPELFTLTEIQKVSEIITGEKYPAPAFRRKIAGLVEETDQYTEAAGHRPSKLFRRRG